MDSQKIKAEFEEIVRSVLIKTPLPVVQDKSIRIGKVIITPKSDGYRVYDLKRKAHLGKTYSKNAAIALANSSSKAQEILDLDREYSKYDIDCSFYNYTIHNSKDQFRQEIAEIRYYDAENRKDAIAGKLNKFIFPR